MLLEVCGLPVDEALDRLKTSMRGLSIDEAEDRLDEYGPNELSHLRRLSLYQDILYRFKSPLVIQLLIIAVISGLIGELKAAVIVGFMILLSVGLSYVLDRRSNQAVEALGRQVQSRACVLRDGKEIEVRVSEVVPGDICILQAGSIVPADLRIIAARDFFVSESALTGESMPVEKRALINGSTYSSVIELPNACFLGTHVISGTARGVVVNTGRRTIFGAISERLTARRPETSFDKGVSSFTWLMMRVMMVMVCLVFFIIGITKGNWIEALLFGISIAVGLTPEMLPMIITVNLAKGYYHGKEEGHCKEVAIYSEPGGNRYPLY
jgi:Mg2+-importing ATPase